MTFGDSIDEPGYGTSWHVPLTTGLNGPHPERWILNFFPRAGWRGVRPVEGAPEFTPEQWHCMQVDIDETGHTRLFQDNEFLSEGDLSDVRRFEPGSAPVFQVIRGGPIYTGEAILDPLPQDAFVMVAHPRIEWWGSS